MTYLKMDGRRALEWAYVVDTLREIIVDDLLPWWSHDTMNIVSIHRTATEEAMAGGRTGIHMVGPPYRAVDIAVPAWNMPDIKVAVDHVNRMWIYDPDRPDLDVAVYKPHGSGPHVHMQIHPNTKRGGYDEAGRS